MKPLWSEESRPEWLPTVNKVRTLEVWFCSNLMFPGPKDREKAERDLLKYITRHAPRGTKSKLAVRVFLTIDLVAMCLKGVRKWTVEGKWGQRFGSSLLDVFREIIRYANADVKHLGRGQSEPLRKDIRERFLEALRNGE